ncbi:SDR family NAD(P)-dependent oxidoreductase [Hymenobacter sp. YC55]|uniref:SDR family NAD(P)-dependent oxidoreductase n=1 Tax=Hymenobacter sp. YC55 TaxID=3034019 RepID=UPI0023F7B45B|nr:SDR family NAD(P)-dependent oxidoreductase [Hymenobacter sp. YC55]MDF7813879.1 SDR family NAD(P)-dependent oxidoreductase [Hymenobacter sp. YC55]
MSRPPTRAPSAQCLAYPPVGAGAQARQIPAQVAQRAHKRDERLVARRSATSLTPGGSNCCCVPPAPRPTGPCFLFPTPEQPDQRRRPILVNPMANTIIIIGAGPGISAAVAHRFGAEGYAVGLIGRTPPHSEALVAQLAAQGIPVAFEAADAGNTADLQAALRRLSAKLGSVRVLLYNAAVKKPGDILRLAADDLVQDFNVNVVGALSSVQAVLEELKQNGGAVLLTGGGLGTHPHPAFGSLSIGKAGLRNLAGQLHQCLQPEGVYAGLLTIKQGVDQGNPAYSSAVMAEHFWHMAQTRTAPETIV